MDLRPVHSVIGTRTGAEVTGLGQIEGLHLVLVDVQVQAVPHENRVTLAGIGVSDLCSEEIQRLVFGRVRLHSYKQRTQEKTFMVYFRM